MNLKCPHCNTIFEVDESHYAALLAQVKTTEFDKEIHRRLEELMKIQKSEESRRMLESEKIHERQISEKDLEIQQLRNKLSSIAADHELTLMKEKNSGREEVMRREHEITELKARLDAQDATAKSRELELKSRNEALLKAKDEEIERYKDLKSRLSTKMLGETLEQHCQNAFNMARSMGQFAEAYFEKDNDASRGTKGDFIFRDYIDGKECVSIMFEMKNEADLTSTKHRNEDFFSKLDKDRNDKECEYAVLVSTLEADSELYNQGIVDVSYRYPKMFVVRPQFFMPVIALLSKSSKRNAETVMMLRTELEIARAQSVDVTKFEERRDKFAGEFMKFIEAHRKKHDDAMDAIDKAILAAEKQIDSLRKIKGLFETGSQKLVRAGEVIENDFTIKKLTHGNPTMRAKFEEARKLKVE